MNETLNSLINDYMSLTGRPLATLTVEEYIKFSSFAATLPSNSCDTDVIKEYDTNDRNAVKPLTETVKKMSEKKKIKQENNLPPRDINKTAEVSQKAVPQTEAPKPNIIDLMKQIKG